MACIIMSTLMLMATTNNAQLLTDGNNGFVNPFETTNSSCFSGDSPGCDLSGCSNNCTCWGKGCDQPSCTRYCRCDGGFCDLSACTTGCDCYVGGCKMSKESQEDGPNSSCRGQPCTTPDGSEWFNPKMSELPWSETENALDGKKPLGSLTRWKSSGNSNTNFNNNAAALTALTAVGAIGLLL